MIAIKLNGEYLEIADSVQIQVEQYNSLFDFESFIQGDHSVDFALKKTDKNCRLFNYINRIDTNQTFASKYPVEVYVDGQLYNIGELKVTSIEKEFKCYLLFGKGTFYDAFATKMHDLTYSNINLEHVSSTWGFSLYRTNPTVNLNFWLDINITRLSDNAVIESRSFRYGGSMLDNRNFCVDHINNGYYGLADPRYFVDHNLFRLKVDTIEQANSNPWVFLYLEWVAPGYRIGIGSSTHNDRALHFYTGTDTRMLYYRLIYIKKMIAHNAAFATYNDIGPYNFLPIYNYSFQADDDYCLTVNAYYSYALNHNIIEWGAKKRFHAVPFFSFKWFVQKAIEYIQSETGYTFTTKINDVYTAISNIFIYNTNSLHQRVDYRNGWYGDNHVEIENFNQFISPKNHLPNITISQLIVSLRKMFSIRFKVDAKAKTIDLIYSNEIIDGVTNLDLSRLTISVDSYNSSFKNLSISLSTADPATQTASKNLDIPTATQNYYKPDLPSDFSYAFDTKTTYVEIDKMILYIQKFSEYWDGNDTNKVIEKTLEKKGFINNNIEYPLGNNDNKTIGIGISTLLQDISGYAEIPISFGEYGPIKTSRYCVISDQSGSIDLSNEIKDLVLIKKTGYDEQPSSLGISIKMKVPRSGALQVKELYDNYWKTFLEKIEADKYYKIKAVLPLHYLQLLQENGKFYLHNREFIFESISTNLTNKAESARMYEVEIVAYRLK